MLQWFHKIIWNHIICVRFQFNSMNIWCQILTKALRNWLPNKWTIKNVYKMTAWDNCTDVFHDLVVIDYFYQRPLVLLFFIKPYCKNERTFGIITRSLKSWQSAYKVEKNHGSFQMFSEGRTLYNEECFFHTRWKSVWILSIKIQWRFGEGVTLIFFVFETKKNWEGNFYCLYFISNPIVWSVISSTTIKKIVCPFSILSIFSL